MLVSDCQIDLLDEPKDLEGCTLVLNRLKKMGVVGFMQKRAEELQASGLAASMQESVMKNSHADYDARIKDLEKMQARLKKDLDKQAKNPQLEDAKSRKERIAKAHSVLCSMKKLEAILNTTPEIKINDECTLKGMEAATFYRIYCTKREEPLRLFVLTDPGNTLEMRILKNYDIPSDMSAADWGSKEGEITSVVFSTPLKKLYNHLKTHICKELGVEEEEEIQDAQILRALAVYTLKHQETLIFRELKDIPKPMSLQKNVPCMTYIDFETIAKEGDCSTWLTWLADHFDEEQQKVFKLWIGSTMWEDDRCRQCLTIVGGKQSGKSYAGRFLRDAWPSHLCGDGFPSSESLADKRAYSRVFGKHFVFWDDCKKPNYIESEVIHSSLAGAWAPVQFMRMDPFTAWVKIKMLVCSNDPPKFQLVGNHTSRMLYLRMKDDTQEEINAKLAESDKWEMEMKLQVHAFYKHCYDLYVAEGISGKQIPFKGDFAECRNSVEDIICEFINDKLAFEEGATVTHSALRKPWNQHIKQQYGYGVTFDMLINQLSMKYGLKYNMVEGSRGTGMFVFHGVRLLERGELPQTTTKPTTPPPPPSPDDGDDTMPLNQGTPVIEPVTVKEEPVVETQSNEEPQL